MSHRVQIFKPSGKWYTEIEVPWFYHGPASSENDFANPATFKEVIETYTNMAYGRHRFAGMTAVCTDTNPCGFPQMCVVPE